MASLTVPEGVTPQGSDGTPFISYYETMNSLSFVWDGKNECILVSEGGYGEAVVDWFGVPRELVTADGLHEMLTAFENVCERYTTNIFEQGESSQGGPV